MPFNNPQDEDNSAPNELLSLRSQLTTSINSQVDLAKKGLQSLEAHSKLTIPRLSTACTQITTLCQEAEGLLSTAYPLIRSVSRAHANFKEVARVKERFSALQADIAEAEAMLPGLGEELVPRDLLILWAKLSRLESFRKETMEDLALTSQSVQLGVKRYFRRLDDLSATFERLFWDWLSVEQLPLLAQEPPCIVAVVKVCTRMPIPNKPKNAS